MNQLALQLPGQPLAIRAVSLWTVVRARLTFLSVWAQSSPGCLSGPSCPLVLDRGWKGFFWSLTLAVSHRDDPCVQTVQSLGQIVDPLASRRSSVSSQCLVGTPLRKDTGSVLQGSWSGQRWDHSV